MSTVKPLVVTPLPNPNEGLTSFILRTSEMNGYTTPVQMLRHAGMNENQMRSVWPPIEKLALLYARSPKDFICMGYSTDSDNQRRKNWRLLNHVIPAIYMNVKSSKICPECVSELGHIEAFWDLRHAIACPVHKKYAIKKCPSCHQHIKWLRQGLLLCRCGYDLSELRGEPLRDEAILNMLALLKAKLHDNLQGNQQLIDCEFPISDIESISFSTLICIVGRLGLSRKRNRYDGLPEGVTDEMYSLANAYKVFQGWPFGLYDYLENMPSEKNMSESFNLQSQFSPFFIKMFKTGLPRSETAFIRKAFVSFGNERWKKQGFIDIRLANSANESRHVVGISGLAKYLGVMPPTVMSYVRKGLIKGQLLTSGKRTRRIFDLTKDVPFKPAEGRYYKQREAAQFLGLPVKLLCDLRRKGIYKVVRLGWGIDGYSELDLIEFRTRLLMTAHEEVNFDTEIHITLGEVLRKKRLGHLAATEIISDLLKSTFIPCGSLGSQIRDIFLTRVEFEKRLTYLEIRDRK